MISTTIYKDIVTLLFIRNMNSEEQKRVIYSILDKRLKIPEEAKKAGKDQNNYGVLKNMTDTDFEKFLPDFCETLELYGFDNVICNLIKKQNDEKKEWEHLKNWNKDENTIKI